MRSTYSSWKKPGNWRDEEKCVGSENMELSYVDVFLFIATAVCGYDVYLLVVNGDQVPCS